MKRVVVAICLVATVSCGSLPQAPRATKAQCSNFQNAERFDCYPEDGSNQAGCEARGCCWVPAGMSLRPATGSKAIPLDVPWCFFPSDYNGYKYLNYTQNPNGGATAFLKRQFQSPYPRDVETLRVDVDYQTENRVRVKISDPVNKRYEAPYPKINNKEVKAVDNPNYSVNVDLNQPGFQVTRKNGEVLFNSNVGGFIFSDLFLQISSTFNGTIYGLGEHRTPLALNTAWTRLTMFNHDHPPQEDTNLYGSHPFYIVTNDKGESHGVFLHNSNGMDVLLQPLNAITFRPIGGILDLYFFMGPSPADVVRQYLELVGRPFFPPYWSLGFQLCRYGYNSVEGTRAVWERTRNAGIPFDVQWNDIDYMITQNDFTIDPVNYKGLKEFVDEVHSVGMHYVPILDPGVSAAEPSGSYPPFDDGVSMDVLVKDNNGDIFIAKVWNPVSTAFPDFFHPRAQEYWTKQVKALYDKLPLDGLWIDMNEPSNFYDGSNKGCPWDDELEKPPYVPAVDGGQLAYKTICMTAKHATGIHYNLHNLYGISEAEVAHNTLKEILGNRRSFLLSRSTFSGSGAYTGHWSGDDFSTWNDLQKSIPEILNSNIFGIPFVGADICGFIFDSNHNLCNRWMQLGAFYPFSRNHNTMGTIDQDPAAFGDDVIQSSKKALLVRYALLPYLYTLFFRATVNGDTVARPLFFEFPEDSQTHAIDTTFMWGSGLLIIPVLEDNKDSVTAYIPKGRWYDWYTQNAIDSTGTSMDFDAPFDKINLLIRGGVVIPTQAPSTTTTYSRINDFTFIAAADSNNNADGELFWDDGESQNSIEENKSGLLSFKLIDRQFTSQVQYWGLDSKDAPQLGSIKVLGISGSVNEVTLNGKSVAFSVGSNKVLTVNNISLPLTTNVTLTWS